MQLSARSPQLGCRVVGSVGSDKKAEWLKTHCGVDATINYRTCGQITKALADAAPEGIDVYFENVGGEHLQAALNVMNPFGARGRVRNDFRLQ